MIRPFLIAAAVLAGSPALAQEMIVTNRAVSYADLDLGNVAGRATLLRRIRGAVIRVCGDAFGDAGSQISNDIIRCRSAARRDALAKMSQAVARADGQQATKVASVR